MKTWRSTLQETLGVCLLLASAWGCEKVAKDPAVTAVPKKQSQLEVKGRCVLVLTGKSPGTRSLQLADVTLTGPSSRADVRLIGSKLDIGKGQIGGYSHRYVIVNLKDKLEIVKLGETLTRRTFSIRAIGDLFQRGKFHRDGKLCFLSTRKDESLIVDAERGRILRRWPKLYELLAFSDKGDAVFVRDLHHNTDPEYLETDAVGPNYAFTRRTLKAVSENPTKYQGDWVNGDGNGSERYAYVESVGKHFPQYEGFWAANRTFHNVVLGSGRELQAFELEPTGQASYFPKVVPLQGSSVLLGLTPALTPEVGAVDGVYFRDNHFPGSSFAFLDVNTEEHTLFPIADLPVEDILLFAPFTGP